MTHQFCNGRGNADWAFLMSCTVMHMVTMSFFSANEIKTMKSLPGRVFNFYMELAVSLVRPMHKDDET